MNKYVSLEDVAKMAFSMMGLSNTEWVQALQGLPTIDIVRCKECKYRDYWGSCTFLQNKGDAHKPIMTDADDFCSYGERREP